MIWGILATLGVPLWVCAAGISVLVMRNRAIRHRPGNVKVRRRCKASRGGRVGTACGAPRVRVSRYSAAWAESFIPVREAVTLSPLASDRKKLRRLGAQPLIVRPSTTMASTSISRPTPAHAFDLFGPFGSAAAMNALDPRLRVPNTDSDSSDPVATLEHRDKE